MQEEGSESWLGFILSFLKHTKQDESRYHVWNIDKLYKLDTCVQSEKRNNTCEINSETHTSLSYIEITHDVCKWLQNQKIHNTKYINIKVYQINSLPTLVASKIFFPLTWRSLSKSITPPEEWHWNHKFLPLFDMIVKWHRKPKNLTGNK